MTDSPFVISLQGAAQANHGVVYDGELIAIYIDLKSKYCKVDTWGSDDDVPMVMILVSEHTPEHHILMGTQADDFTQIDFPDYRGWKVMMADCSKYTLRVVLSRDRV